MQADCVPRKSVISGAAPAIAEADPPKITAECPFYGT